MNDYTLACPVPVEARDKITLAHGSGGRTMHRLIKHIFTSEFDRRGLQSDTDAAVLLSCRPGERLAMTTDSFVVSPYFFPGGNIGSLAVHGTVNDLAMMGARPQYLTVGFILEEGLPIEHLRKIVRAMRIAAEEAGVLIVTGDTKVVEHGHGDGIYINTTGVGFVRNKPRIRPEEIDAGDAIIVSGGIGRHGMAIMSVREGLAFDTSIRSDSAPLNRIVRALLDGGIRIRCMRDITRGGLASGLCEVAMTTGFHFDVEEESIPIDEQVQAACELLGLDPMHVACEGRFIAFISPEDAERALAICKQYPAAENAAIIGTVKKAADETAGTVTMRTAFGGERFVEMLPGDQLPRIC